VEETGLLITIDDIDPGKTQRHLDGNFPDIELV
jgi:hypothetical protein